MVDDRCQSCVFCAIVAGAAPASFVHEGDDVVAFLDLRPATQGHLLVVPRAHVPRLAHLDEELGASLWRTGQRLGSALYRSGVRCEGLTVFLADGIAAGQEVFHVHLHVIPRFPRDRMRLAGRKRAAERAELDAVASRIRAAGGIGPPPRS